MQETSAAGGRVSGLVAVALTALTGALLAGAAPAGAAPLHRGDLLVADAQGNRVLRVRPMTGATTVFSPPPGGTNLLDEPRGMAVGRDGTVYVAEGSTQHVVAIDPETGAQRYLTTLQFPNQVPVAFGDLRAITTDRLGRVFVFDDAVHQVVQLTANELGWLKATVWSPIAGTLTARRLAPSLDASGAPLSFLAVVLDGTRVSYLPYGGDGARAGIAGVPTGIGAVVADISVKGACAADDCVFAYVENATGDFFSCSTVGVYAFVITPPDPGPPIISDPEPPDYTLAYDGFTGGSCARAVAVASPQEVYVARGTATGLFPRVDRVRLVGGVETVEFVSNLSTGPIAGSGQPTAMVIWVPEAGSAGAGAATLAALAALASARRGRAARREGGAAVASSAVPRSAGARG